MQIDVLANKTVKITLNRLDMSEYDVKYESLSHKSPDTKRLLVELLAVVRLEKKLDLSGERLFIEAFPKTDGGCMLYISCLESGKTQAKHTTTKPKNEHTLAKPLKLYETIICEILDINSLGKLCISLDSQIKRCHQSCCTALYWAKLDGENIYRLAVTDLAPISRDLKGIMREFGELYEDDDVLFAQTTEHFKLIAEYNAADIIARTLS